MVFSKIVFSLPLPTECEDQGEYTDNEYIKLQCIVCDENKIHIDVFYNDLEPLFDEIPNIEYFDKAAIGERIGETQPFCAKGTVIAIGFINNTPIPEIEIDNTTITDTPQTTEAFKDQTDENNKDLLTELQNDLNLILDIIGHDSSTIYRKSDRLCTK